MKIIPFFAAMLSGALLATQPSINAALARRIGGVPSATFSMAVSLAVLIAVWLVWYRVRPDLVALAMAPKWAWLGGIVGAIFLIVALTLVPRIGAANFFVFLVIGQLLAALCIDHFGLFNAPVIPLSGGRLAGVGLVIAGILLTQRA